MDLQLGQVRARRGQGIEQRVPQRVRDDEHVVRGCLWLRADRRADGLEQGVCLGDVNDSVDLDGDRIEAGAADRDRVTGLCGQICSRLLEQQDAAAGAGQVTKLSRKRRAVLVADPDDLAWSRGLSGAVLARFEARCRCEANTLRRDDVWRRRDGVRERCGISAWLRFDLPVDRDGLDRALRHGRLGCGQERGERREQTDRERNADGRGSEAAGTSPDEAGEPGAVQAAGPDGVHVQHGAVTFTVTLSRSRPPCIDHRRVRRSATAVSCVLTISAAPISIAVAMRASITTAPLAWSS